MLVENYGLIASMSLHVQYRQIGLCRRPHLLEQCPEHPCRPSWSMSEKERSSSETLTADRWSAPHAGGAKSPRPSPMTPIKTWLEHGREGQIVRVGEANSWNFCLVLGGELTLADIQEALNRAQRGVEVSLTRWETLP